MENSLSLWIAFALAVFWSVGVHNRLMRLRAAVWDAAASFERQMQLLMGLCKEVLLERDTSDPGVDALAMAVQTMAQSMKSAKQAKAAAPGYCAAMGAPWGQMQQTGQAIFFVTEGVVEPQSGATNALLWSDGCTKANFAKAAATLAVADYNAALRQAPACWVAGFMGFYPLAPLA